MGTNVNVEYFLVGSLRRLFFDRNIWQNFPVSSSRVYDLVVLIH